MDHRRFSTRAPDKAEAASRETLSRVRDPLFELHRLLLAQVREQHEQQAGPVSPHEFFRLLLNAPGFQWLRPFSALLSALDEVLDKPPEDPAEYHRVLESVENLFRFTGEETDFSRRYKEHIQSSPEIASRHGELRQLLPRRGTQWS